MALFCVISANSGSFRAHRVIVHVRYLISWWVLVLTVIIPYCANFRLILHRLPKKWPAVQSSISSIRLWIYCNKIWQTAFDVLANLVATVACIISHLTLLYFYSTWVCINSLYSWSYALVLSQMCVARKRTGLVAQKRLKWLTMCSNNCLSHLRMRAASVIMLYGVHGLHPLLSVAKHNLYSFSQLMASLPAYARSYKMPLSLSTVWLRNKTADFWS